MIITSDGTTFAEELNSCDGSDPAIAFAYTCSIPMINLIVAPHNLVEGDTIRIKVIATSSNGDSDDSPINSDTILVLVPAQPVLINDFITTTQTALALAWTLSTTGGEPIINYSLYYTEDGSDEFSLVTDSLTTNSYITQPSLGLITGQKYKF